MFRKFAVAAIAAFAFASSAFASDYNGTFQKKAYKIQGSWTLTQVDGQQVIRFNDDFRTKMGPDLKIILSQKSINSLSKNPTLKTPLNLGLIQSNKGQQDYVLPEGVTLGDYESILIHCEAYNVLWGGFNIPNANTRGVIGFGS